MLIDIKTIIQKYNINLSGVIHVGGHIGEEIPLYKRYTNNIHIFEPQKHCFDAIDNSVNKYCVALGEFEDEMNLHIANNNQSSSLLKPKQHLVEHPDVLFGFIQKVKVLPLDSFNISNCNFINIDVQGYELQVLKGANNTLKSIDYIYTEVNTKEIYENCTLMDQLDIYLSDFIRLETEMCANHGWGDALYVRKNKIK